MKLVGALVCFCVSVMIGAMAGKTERTRTEECTAFSELFTYIQNQIGYFSAPTKLIYRGVQSDVLSRIGFLEALVSHEQDAVYFDVWGMALASCQGRLHLTASQYEIVRNFGACIGKSNEDLQMKRLDYYRQAMAAETEKQKAEMKKNIKVSRTLGFAVGTAAVILAL